MKKIIKSNNKFIIRNSGLMAVERTPSIYDKPYFSDDTYTYVYPNFSSQMQLDVYPDYPLNDSGSPIGGGFGYQDVKSPNGANFVVNTLHELKVALDKISNFTLDDGYVTVTQGSNLITHISPNGKAGQFNNGEIINQGMQIRVGGNCEPILEYVIDSVDIQNSFSCIIKLKTFYSTPTRVPYPITGSDVDSQFVYIFKPQRIHILESADIDITDSGLHIPGLCTISSSRGNKNDQGAKILTNNLTYTRSLQGNGGSLKFTYGSRLAYFYESNPGANDAGMFVYYNDVDYNGQIHYISEGDFLFRSSGYSAMIGTLYKIERVTGKGTDICEVLLDRTFWFVTQTVDSKNQGLWKKYEGELFSSTGGSSANIFTINMHGINSRITGIRLFGPMRERSLYSLNSTGIHTEASNITVDNNYIMGFPGFGVSLKNCVGHKIQYNYISRCIREGYGYGVLVNNGESYSNVSDYYPGDHVVCGIGASMVVGIGKEVHFTQNSNIVVFYPSDGEDDAGTFNIGRQIQRLQIGDSFCSYDTSDKVDPDGISFYTSHVYYEVVENPVYDPINKTLTVKIDRNFVFMDVVRPMNQMRLGLRGHYKFIKYHAANTFDRSEMVKVDQPRNYASLISHNVFESNRHSVAGGGGISSSYDVFSNYFCGWNTHHMVDRHADGGASIILRNIVNQRGSFKFFGGLDYNPGIIADVSYNYLRYEDDDDSYAIAKHYSKTNNLSLNHPDCNFTMSHNKYIDDGWITSNEPNITIISEKSQYKIGEEIKLTVSGVDPFDYPLKQFEWCISNDTDEKFFSSSKNMNYRASKQGNYVFMVRGINSYGNKSGYACVNVLVVDDVLSPLKKDLISWWDFDGDIEDKHLNKLNFRVNGNPNFKQIDNRQGFCVIKSSNVQSYDPYEYGYLNRVESNILNLYDKDLSMVCWMRKDDDICEFWRDGQWIPKPNKYTYPLSIKGANTYDGGGIEIRWKDVESGLPSPLLITITDGVNISNASFNITVGELFFVCVAIDRDSKADFYLGRSDGSIEKKSTSILFNNFSFEDMGGIYIGEKQGSRAIVSMAGFGIFRKALNETEVNQLFNSGNIIKYNLF